MGIKYPIFFMPLSNLFMCLYSTKFNYKLHTRQIIISKINDQKLQQFFLLSYGELIIQKCS